MRPNRLVAVALFTIVGFATVARADTIFSQAYTGAAPGWTSDSAFPNTTSPQLFADDFTLMTAAVATDFHWWSAYGSGSNPANAPDGTWGLTIYEDVASLQAQSGGLVVPLANMTRVFTGDVTPGGNAIFAYVADFATPLTLQAGTYYALLLGNSGTAQFGGWIGTPGTGDWTWVRTSRGWSQMEVRMAFEITGTPVPEPASLLLLGTGLIGAIRGLRRTRL